MCGSAQFRPCEFAENERHGARRQDIHPLQSETKHERGIRVKMATNTFKRKIVISDANSKARLIKALESDASARRPSQFLYSGAERERSKKAIRAADSETPMYVHCLAVILRPRGGKFRRSQPFLDGIIKGADHTASFSTRCELPMSVTEACGLSCPPAYAACFPPSAGAA